MTEKSLDELVRDAQIEEPARNGTHASDSIEDMPPFMSMVQMWKHQKGLQHAWKPWILLNNLTLIGGVPNVGKSPLLLSLVAGYLRGRWPDGARVPEVMAGGKVVYVLPEGFAEQTEILLDWGLDVQEIGERIITPFIPMPGKPDEPNFSFKIDSDDGRHALTYTCDVVEPKLIIIDGLRAAMSGDESSSADVDTFMAPLLQLANSHGAAVVMSHHLVKGSESASFDGAQPSVDWFRGSGDIIAKVRSAWIVDRPNPITPTERRITLVKAATGPSGLNMAFTMSDPTNGLEFTSDVPRPPAKSKKKEAERFILDVLADGKQTHEQLWELAQADGLDLSTATFRDARVALSNRNQIVSVNEGKAYFWALPAPDTIDDIPI